MARGYKSASDLVVEPVVYAGVGITSPKNGSNPQPGDSAPSLTNDSRNYMMQEAQPPRKYIVRRLTPTECARLQGFPDWWGEMSEIKSISDDGLAKWEMCRKDLAEAQGKEYKSKSAESLIKWLNGLHTDSAEYKMWGNGIALPCAVDVLSRIKREFDCDASDAASA